jgi:hypothetical protein
MLFAFNLSLPAINQLLVVALDAHLRRRSENRGT